MNPNLTVIVGLGKTGLSCVRYLAAKGVNIAVTDNRKAPPELAIIQKEYPNIPIACGEFSDALISQATELVVSPGVSLKEPVIAKAIARGIKPIGDIELFLQELLANIKPVPVIAITGSNGKSTVTTLVGDMALRAGLRAGVGGNLGKPVLEFLSEAPYDLFVLELSSFQLDTTFSLKAAVSTILNVSPNHLDRHGTMEAYIAAKQVVFHNSERILINLDNPMSWQAVKNGLPCDFVARDDNTQRWGFTLQEKPDHTLAEKIFHVMTIENKKYLACDQQPLMKVSDCYLNAPHHLQNALAALALGTAIHLPIAVMCETLKTFKGLKHRCELVSKNHGVSWYDDSKGTTTTAGITAMQSLSAIHPHHGLILIAGGEAKETDFHEFAETAKNTTKAVILMGRDAKLIAGAIEQIRHPVYFVDSMPAAVEKALSLANPGDGVLLSPACASYDMFKNFEHRGDMFTKAVTEL